MVQRKQEIMNTINEDDKFYWICDADDCYFVREHGVGQHIAKCTTKERAEQITKALSEIERLRKENEELNVVNENIGKQSGDRLIVIMQLKDELAALKKQVEEKDKEIGYLKTLWDDQFPAVRNMPAGNIFDGPK